MKQVSVDDTVYLSGSQQINLFVINDYIKKKILCHSIPAENIIFISRIKINECKGK